MKNLLKKAALIAMLSTVILSCTKKNDIPAEAEIQTNQNQKVLAYIKNLGFTDAQIVDNGDNYVVDGDIVFSKKMEVPADYGKAITEQYYNGYIVTNSTNIRVKIDPSITSMTSEINSAINQWNTVPNSKLKFVITTGTVYDILIKVDNTIGSSTCGQAYLSTSNGKAGNTVWINQALIQNNSFAQRTRTITHEFGHTISFKHTNQSTTTNVPGVGGTDAQSLMNGGQCGSGATVLSTKDKQATAVLYPL
ncbi:Dual-action HEIGH metallo-peptidase [Pedobacter terrae]|uniref:Dual-action HEIGH metallo-peptidase n=1 Tax=Pedobacter terrae TaxID=405671 RepID=A0A1G8CDR7_9SPHI|nr:M57 family metalloprotease [Pedobacter terrae]SDH12945.1 Dual-action HEIGH metallo-peptidase [Pedobacter terrae]SDH43585.1 Dual-action HEIGH metallo-peptidase [Pedobacter terrae]